MSVKKYGLYEVTAVKLNVRNRPDENSEILGHLTKGTRIKVYSFTSDWALIMYSENLNWVSADYLVLVSKD
ncbi:hypothetical protein GCM10009098_07410 [Rheinheimera aquimaris]|uniref:SH3b domain-containing protein n=2 Tax=Rheinheimera aquimaris TaxID=412437 RepID=A0ABN1DGE9_9GAMM